MGGHIGQKTPFDGPSDSWWSEDGYLNLLKGFINPWRIPYFKSVVSSAGIDPRRAALLEVGCGGGLLAEELASMGFTVVGIDPSGKSLDAARAHAARSGLSIDYRRGSAEELPFQGGTFDVVTCCDVLEHVQGWRQVLREIARVLRPGGVFFFDTINRTALSKLIFIKIGQEWRLTRIAPGNLHAWEMFIKPGEILRVLTETGFHSRGLVGGRLCGNPIDALRNVLCFKKGRISAAELGRRLRMKRTRKLWLSYAGYALRD